MWNFHLKLLCVDKDLDKDQECDNNYELENLPKSPERETSNEAVNFAPPDESSIVGEHQECDNNYKLEDLPKSHERETSNEILNIYEINY